MVTTYSPKSDIVKKLENILYAFGKKLFNTDKRVPIEIEEVELNKIVNGDVYSAFRYEDGKIFVKSGYLDFIIKNYKNHPEIIKDLFRGMVHEYVHALLDADPKKEETKKYLVAHEGLATLIGNLYERISSEIKIDSNENLESILENVNKQVLEKIKDKKYLEKLNSDVISNFNRELNEEIDKISEKYNKCLNVPDDSTEIFDLREGVKYHTMYKIPSLILWKEPGIQKIIEDLSRKVPIDKYQEIIFNEFEKIPGKEIIANTLDCLEKKINSHLDFILNSVINSENKIENLKATKLIKE